MIGSFFAHTHKMIVSLYAIRQGRYSLEDRSSRPIDRMPGCVKTLTSRPARALGFTGFAEAQSRI